MTDDVSRQVDRNEVRRLYDLHGRALLGYACSMTADYSTAEDVLHQVFVRLLRGDIRISGSAATYLHSAIRNAALNHHRRHFREAELKPDGNLKGIRMDRHDEEFEQFLKQFQPRRPRALPEVVFRRHSSLSAWLVAAALALVCLGTSVMLWRIAPAELNDIVLDAQRNAAVETNVAAAVTLGRLTQLAMGDGQRFDMALTEASRYLLPDVQKPDGTLYVLAGE